jgi:hypothetical protein
MLQCAKPLTPFDYKKLDFWLCHSRIARAAFCGNLALHGHGIRIFVFYILMKP